MRKVQSSELHRWGGAVHTCSLGTMEEEAGGLAVQSHTWLHREFEASLEYMRSCLEKPKDRQTDKKHNRTPIYGACSLVSSETPGCPSPQDIPYRKVCASGLALVTDLVALVIARVGTGCMGTGAALWSAGMSGAP